MNFKQYEGDVYPLPGSLVGSLGEKRKGEFLVSGELCVCKDQEER